MIRQYDEFAKLGLKDMSKKISDMTYLYVNPETHRPTVVPPKHYDKILSQVKEELTTSITRRSFLTVMYNQIKALRDEEPKLFQEAFLCLEKGLKPTDLRINEDLALRLVSEMLDDKRNKDKKNFHLLDSDILEYFDEMKNDPSIHAQILRETNSMKRDDDFER